MIICDPLKISSIRDLKNDIGWPSEISGYLIAMAEANGRTDERML